MHDLAVTCMSLLARGLTPLLTYYRHPGSADSVIAALQREVESDAWRAALARAEGAKVYDDPKQLRRTIKAEQKAKSKRQDAWKERTERQQQGMVAKQQKCVLLMLSLLVPDTLITSAYTARARQPDDASLDASAHIEQWHARVCSRCSRPSSSNQAFARDTCTELATDALQCCRRTENLKARTTAKVERRKEKREKKLLRPGFEGRRDSFIRSPSAGGGASKAAATTASS